MHLHSFKYNNALAHWTCSVRVSVSGRVHEYACYVLIMLVHLEFLLLFSLDIWKLFNYSQGHLSWWPHLLPLLFLSWCNVMLWLPFPRIWLDHEHTIIGRSGVIDPVLSFCDALYFLFSLQVLFSVSLAHFYEYFEGIKLVSNWNGCEIKPFLCFLFHLHFFIHLHFKNFIVASNETIYNNKRTWIYDFLHTFTQKLDLHVVLQSPLYSKCNAKLPFWMELFRFLAKYELKKNK